MSRTLSVLAMLMLLVWTTAAATAQEEEEEAEALPPSVELNVLYAHGTGEDEFIGFMDTLEDGGDDTSMGSGQYAASAKSWRFDLQPNLTNSLVLDMEETIDVFVYFGQAQGAGRLSLTTTLSSGDVVVAEGEAETHTYAAEYSLVEWNLEPMVDTISAGTNLTWTIKASGTASAGAVGTSEDRGRSNVTLPITGVVGGSASTPVTYTNITNESVAETLDLVNATSGIYSYNWTLNGTNGVTGEIIIDGTGNVTFAATDGNGSEVFNLANRHDTAAGNGTGGNGSKGGTAMPLDDPTAAPGNWTLNITLANFTGTIELLLDPASPAPPGPTNGTAAPIKRTATPTSSGAANETNETGEGRGVPGNGPLLVLGALMAIAIAVRRRRA